jgi:hypothetical protein
MHPIPRTRLMLDGQLLGDGVSGIGAPARAHHGGGA